MDCAFDIVLLGMGVTLIYGNWLTRRKTPSFDVCAGEGASCPMLVSVRRYSCTQVISFQVVGLFLLLFLKLAI